METTFANPVTKSDLVGIIKHCRNYLLEFEKKKTIFAFIIESTKVDNKCMKVLVINYLPIVYLNILMFIVIVCNSRPFAPNKAGLKPYILLCTNDFGAVDLMIQ